MQGFFVCDFKKSPPQRRHVVESGERTLPGGGLVELRGFCHELVELGLRDFDRHLGRVRLVDQDVVALTVGAETCADEARDERFTSRLVRCLVRVHVRPLSVRVVW